MTSLHTYIISEGFQQAKASSRLEDGKECCKMLTSTHDETEAPMNLQQL